MSDRMITIWYCGVDGGDGTISVQFFESQECIELLEEAIPEYYRGEGGNSFKVEPYSTENLEVRTLAECKEEIKDWEKYS